MLTNKLFTALSISFFLLFMSLTTSCVEEPPYLNSTQLKLVDTLAKNQIIPLQIELDNLCDLRFDKEVEKAKDSIIIVRMEEINKRLRK